MRKYVIDQLRFILKIACHQGWVTSFHLNDDVMEFCNRFYPDDWTKGRQIFTRRCNKLVELGFLKKAERTGSGPLGYLDFGVKTITTWEVENLYFHNCERALDDLDMVVGEKS